MNYLNLSPQRLLATTTLTAMTLGVAGLTGGSAQAGPAPLGDTWDVPGKPEYQVCVDLGATSCDLQDLLDVTVGAGLIDVVADQTGKEWFTPLDDYITGSLMFEVAGFSNKNAFGIYNGKGDMMQLFGGPSSAPESKTVSLGEDFSEGFGFYLTNKKGTFYSQSAKNPGGDQQALVYKGINDHEFIIAFEDLVLDDSDADYNDFVVTVGAIEAVPEPSMLLGLGVLGASFWSVRRRRSHS